MEGKEKRGGHGTPASVRGAEAAARPEGPGRGRRPSSPAGRAWQCPRSRDVLSRLRVDSCPPFTPLGPTAFPRKRARRGLCVGSRGSRLRMGAARLRQPRPCPAARPLRKNGWARELCGAPASSEGPSRPRGARPWGRSCRAPWAGEGPARTAEGGALAWEAASAAQARRSAPARRHPSARLR